MKTKTSLQRTTHSSGLSRLVPWITALGCAFTFGMTASAGIIPGQYVIRTKSKADSDRFETKHGLKAAFKFMKKDRKNRPKRTLTAKLNRGQLLKIMKDRDVDVIVPDRSFSIANAELWRIESGGEGGSGYEQPQVVPAGVNRIGAYGLTYTGAGVGVAVVDTGLDFLHNDLAPVSPISFSAFGGSAQDDHGHGTHVGGIIAARNNAVDVVGTAPLATLYAVKVLDSQAAGSDSTIIAGLEWIADNANLVTPPIKVVNMSISRVGMIDDNPILRDAVADLYNMGITVVAAAGNYAMAEVTQIVPATYPEVLAVASTTAESGTGIPADTASKFTTDGMFWQGMGVTISAPGDRLENLVGGTVNCVGLLSTKLGGGTEERFGTSMSAPHVAGVAALMQEKALHMLYPEQIRGYIIAGASNPNAPLDNPDPYYTFDGDLEGVLDAPGALNF